MRVGRLGHLGGDLGGTRAGVLDGEEPVGEAEEVMDGARLGHGRHRADVGVPVRGDAEHRTRPGIAAPRSVQAWVQRLCSRAFMGLPWPTNTTGSGESLTARTLATHGRASWPGGATPPQLRRRRRAAPLLVRVGARERLPQGPVALVGDGVGDVAGPLQLGVVARAGCARGRPCRRGGPGASRCCRARTRTGPASDWRTLWVVTRRSGLRLHARRARRWSAGG